MNVNLTPKLEEMVKDKVATGLYNNASEVVREALRLMEARDRHEVLREEAQKGAVQLREGRSSALEMKAAKKVAEQNAKRGRKVNPLVAP
ncbi:type II toxin-antitoxin system ParD family antitoxin [Paraburkholderia sediminicola]|uniref:type II toxin-antitoxin system ParD family antitoxin n=1 Tax=Paraburkholderia sediminicola TaxID=458836 RepID=UPI0038B8F376